MGAEEKLTDGLLLFKCVFAKHTGNMVVPPALQLAILLGGALVDFFVSHNPQSFKGFSAKPISAKSAVS